MTKQLENEYYDELEQYMRDLAAELGVSVSCAQDVWYLRTRSRHTPMLENELIARHAAGNPPNMNDFGVTTIIQEETRKVCEEVEDLHGS